ncbi:MAG: 16S rRNA (cytosine(967)-C(5))-methyltransferase RsmB [Pseudomonadales bacterium]|nr:16S rRNA (cytosine(967)-C(5))-methyltransferase RsmB [Pseudomonadales bacterium]
MQEYLATTQILNAVLHKGRSLDASFSKTNSPLTKQICYGVIRHYYELEFYLAQLLNKPLAKKHQDLHILLLAGLYSISHLRRPSHTSVNAVVETTMLMKKHWAKGLLNGVLRNYIRNQAKLTAQSQQDEAISSNHPPWLLHQIKQHFPQYIEQILSANNHQAPMTLRVNLSRISRDDYQMLLKEQNINSSSGTITNSALYLETPIQVDELPGFKDGLVSVQDEASQIAATLLNISPGNRILDACAAPGGKTCHILEQAQNITLTAIDIDNRRLQKIHENLNRLKYQCIVSNDGLESHTSNDGYDRILLDAPCSATGIIRRHPDIKLLRRESDIKNLAITQLTLLQSAWKLLNNDGELIYSTCSILPAENENVIAAFIANNDSAVVLSIDAQWGYKTNSGVQILPSRESTDGFFYARLKKQAV